MSVTQPEKQRGVTDILDEVSDAIDELEQRARYEIMELGIPSKKAETLIAERVLDDARHKITWYVDSTIGR